MPLIAASLAGWLLLVPPGTLGTLRTGVLAQPANDRPPVFHVQPDRPVMAAPPADRMADRPGVDLPAARPSDRLVYRPRVDLPVTLAATAAWVFAEVDKVRLVAVACEWCDRTADGRDSLNGFDAWGRRTFRWHNTARATSLSNVTAFALAPAAAYGLDWFAASREGRAKDARVDALLITEAMAIASDVTDVMKFTIGRQRPFVHALAPDAKATTRPSADNNTSFPSGHATQAFSLVMAGAEVASLRGYRYAPWIWRAGLPAAALTAYFRVAADRHYLTDVLAGAGIGSAFGFAVPYLAHRSRVDPRIPAVRLVPTPRGEIVAAQWTWQD